MKLYYAKGACSLAVRIIINEIGIPCEYEGVNLKTKVTNSGADYLKINAKGAVPVLVTDDQEVLTENAVIQQYLADKYHATKLLPAEGDFKRYRVLEWLNFVATDLHKGCLPLFIDKIPAELQEKLFKPMLKNKLKHADQALKSNKFLLGDTFTLPDSYLFVIISWMPHLGVNIEDLTNLQRYYKDLKNYKSVAQALKDEG